MATSLDDPSPPPASAALADRIIAEGTRRTRRRRAALIGLTTLGCGAVFGVLVLSSAGDDNETVDTSSRGEVSVPGGDLVVTIEDGLLCVDGGPLGGWCGDAPTTGAPVAYGTTTDGGPTSPVYVIGVSLDSVQSFVVKLGPQNHDVVPSQGTVEGPDGSVMRAWLLKVNDPPGSRNPLDSTYFAKMLAITDVIMREPTQQ